MRWNSSWKQSDSSERDKVLRRLRRLLDQTLHNWLKAHREGRLGGSGAKPVTPEQMELARLRAELAKTKMKLDIVQKVAACFQKQST